MKKYKFTRRDLAQSFANHCTKMMMVILGCDGKYWVVTPADGERLNRLGYEYEDLNRTSK